MKHPVLTLLNKWYLLSIILLLSDGLRSQDFSALVESAWNNNAQLKSKNFNLAVAQFRYNESKKMYGPELSANIQYTLASGGRSIDIPVGDLLNPVYQTLNILTQSNVFPTIENTEERLLPNNFYDAKFSLTQPIYYPDLAINKAIRLEQINLKQLEIKAYKRWVVKDVMTAWFQYKMAHEAEKIFISADTLLSEAIRSTKSMIRNGIALPSDLARLDNQSALLKNQQIDAAKNIRIAEHYLRFILGIKDTADIPIGPSPKDLPNIDQITELNTREEIDQIQQSIKMQNLAYKAEKQFYLPRIGLQVDAGSQDFDFGWQPYVLMGVNAKVNIFDSNKHHVKKQILETEIASSEQQLQDASNQIALQNKIARENLLAAIEQANNYTHRIEATRKLYDDIYRKYKEGTSGYLELTDAQTQYTQMQIQALIARYQAWTRWAEMIYSAAIYKID